MKIGDRIFTPRFCTVKIKAVFNSAEDARKHGFTETTHYKNPEWNVVGKSVDQYHMEFAAYRK